MISSFDEIPVVDFLPGGLAEIDRPAQQPGLEMNMAAEADVVEHRRSLEELNFLEGAGDPQLRPADGALSRVISCPSKSMDPS